MMETIKKLFIPSYTDDRVDRINDESNRILKRRVKTARRHTLMLEEDGISLEIKRAIGNG